MLNPQKQSETKVYCTYCDTLYEWDIPPSKEKEERLRDEVNVDFFVNSLLSYVPFHSNHPPRARLALETICS